MITAQPGSGPTVLRMLLGSQLRRLREAKGVTRDDAGYTIRENRMWVGFTSSTLGVNTG